MLNSWYRHNCEIPTVFITKQLYLKALNDK